MTSKSGRAVGVRAGWAAMPPVVEDWVSATLGSPVVQAHDQSGGFSPGCATRLRCTDGTRAFVKAVGRELNPDTPILFRREILALERLGSHPLWADLLASYDDGDWVILLLEDIEGQRPDLADDATMGRLLVATDQLVDVMRERAGDLATGGHPAPSAPAFFAPGPVDLCAVFADHLASYDRLPQLPDDSVARWVLDRHAELRGQVAGLAQLPAEYPVHHDIRDDNLLMRPNGDIVFVDWGAFGVGPAWLDPLLARLERVHLPWFDDSLATSPALAAAGDETVTAWLLSMGVHLAVRAAAPVVASLPTMNAFRRAESTRFLDAAARRLEVRPDDLGACAGRC